jgi:peptide/nickel transport system substrate-binding protein
VPALRANRALTVEVVETKGLIGFLRFNHLFPPFDNRRVRQAVLQAVDQREFMSAVVGGNAAYDARCGFFPSGSPCASDAGLDALGGPHDVVAIRRALETAGYQGERIVYLEPTDVPRINAIAEVGADMLRKIGMNVDVVATDWGTTVQRSVSRQPLDKGGWSMYAAFTGGYDTMTPGSHQQLRGNGDRAGNGWPNAPKLEALREAWLTTEDPESQRSITRQMQLQAMDDVPYLPLGSYFQPTAYKANLRDVRKGLIQFTGVRRAA